MNKVREIINISYFDNKNTTLKEHCDIYSNIKKEVLNILNKYDIKYVVAETEAIRDLVKENQQLKEQLEQKENEIKELCKKIKVNEKSRRKMQKSLMETVQKSEKARKEAIDKLKKMGRRT